MNAFSQWFAASPLASALRVFLAIVATMAITDWSTKGTIDMTAWQTYVIAGLVSAVPVITRWLNPADTSFGRGAGVANPFDVFGTED